MRKLLTLLFVLLATYSYPDEFFESDANTINPYLVDAQVFHETETGFYRTVVYRGGFEHITAYLIIQKFTIDWSDSKNPYKLEKSISLDGINGLYNFSVISIKDTGDQFIFTLKAIHAYMYQETDLIVSVTMNLDEFRILSGEL